MEIHYSWAAGISLRIQEKCALKLRNDDDGRRRQRREDNDHGRQYFSTQCYTLYAAHFLSLASLLTHLCDSSTYSLTRSLTQIYEYM